MECYANHRLEAWVAVLLESLLTMCSMSNGCSCKHELVVGRKKTRVKQTQKCNLFTLIIKKLCPRMKAKQLQQQPTRPDNECSWTEALSRKRKTWLRTVAFDRSLVTSIVSWFFFKERKNTQNCKRHTVYWLTRFAIIIACFVAAGSSLRSAHFVAFGPSYAELQRPFLFL